MLKRIGQAQDFPVESQVDGFDQKVVMKHSELEQGEPTAAATKPLLWAHCRGPQKHCSLLPLQLRGFKTGRAWNAEYILQQGIWKTLKNPYASDHKLICETTYTATWKKHLRNFMAKGQNNLHSLCWTLGGSPPPFVFLMSCKLAVEFISKLFQTLSSDYLHALEPVRGSS